MEPDVLYYHEDGKVRYVPQSERAVRFFKSGFVSSKRIDADKVYPFDATHKKLLVNWDRAARQSFAFKEISKP